MKAVLMSGKAWGFHRLRLFNKPVKRRLFQEHRKENI